MKEKISIIVPVYNVADYLEKSVHSLINQTYEQLEIILVNDGSSDRSGEICEELATQDQRIRVLHKENGGLSDARNAGIDSATGEYIGFVDGDDYVAEDMFEQLVRLIREQQADIAEINLIVTDEKNYQKKKETTGHYVLNRDQALKEFFKGNIVENNVCLKLFTKESIGDIRFKKGYTAEDLFFTFQTLLSCQKVAINKDIHGYYYYIRENSIVNSSFSQSNFDAIRLTEQMLELAPQEYHEAIQAKLIREKMKCVSRMMMSGAPEEYRETMQQYLQDIRGYSFRNSLTYLSRKHQLTLMIMKVSPALYVWLYQRFQKQ